MNRDFRNLAIGIVIILLITALYSEYGKDTAQRPQAEEIPYSKFLTGLENRNVTHVTISGNRVSGQTITGRYTNGSEFRTIAPHDLQLVDRLHRNNVAIEVKPAEDDVPSLPGMLVSWLPMLLLIAAWVFFMRKMQSRGGDDAPR